jgi:hypothetical protein
VPRCRAAVQGRGAGPRCGAVLRCSCEVLCSGAVLSVPAVHGTMPPLALRGAACGVGSCFQSIAGREAMRPSFSVVTQPRQDTLRPAEGGVAQVLRLFNFSRFFCFVSFRPLPSRCPLMAFCPPPLRGVAGGQGLRGTPGYPGVPRGSSGYPGVPRSTPGHPGVPPGVSRGPCPHHPPGDEAGGEGSGTLIGDC